MTARDHDAAAIALDGIRSKRRGGNAPQVHRSHPGINDGALNCLGNLAASAEVRIEVAGAGAKIGGIEKLVAARDAAFFSGQRLKILQFRNGIDVNLELRQVNHIAAAPAGAEFQR